MPFYEYECSNCKFYTEVMQKISDAPLTKCPSCGKKALKKLISAPNFRLKGGGWYETDFKGDKENKRNLVGDDRDDSSASKDAVAKPADASKGEAKADGGKTDSAKTEAAAPAAPAASGGTSGSSGSTSTKRAGSGRAAAKTGKAAGRTPSKTRAAPARGKTKPAVKKKGRR